MVKWPWVFLWQVGLTLGPLALLFHWWHRSFRPLGHRLDWLAGTSCITLVLSAAFAQFWHQALWYSWAAICGIAFLYALNSWLTSSQRLSHLLTFQGALAITFSAFSLVAWFFQTVRPYQQTLQQLKSYGIERSFDLQILTLRNWHPIGHQNYVAGYLMLALPLLVGLAFSRSSWQRPIWLAGFALGLATLYSTASRGGWLGLIVSLFVFISLSTFRYPKLRRVLLSSGVVSFVGIVLWGASNQRIRALFTAIASKGEGSELAYRLITNTTGWHIGLDHPLLGSGLGSVSLLYQKYRPDWAGREAELTYQLHSTPAQLWAELGLLGILLTAITLLSIAFLGIRWCKVTSPGTSQDAAEANNHSEIPTPLIIGVISGIAGYSTYALTDYQLDNICISGTLLIYIATLIFANGLDPALETQAQGNRTQHKRIALAGAGVLAAISLWLYPIHRAWMLSSQGFLALQQDDFASFVTYLTKAHETAPWEPYYAHQLAWNLGELAYKSENPQQQESLRQESVQWFEKANAISPNQEFGYSNLGWLQVNSNPQAATQNFLKATQLVPGKKGVFFALGYSLLKEGKTKEALQAMVTELMQQPVLITSPIWQSLELAAFYPQVLASYEAKLNQRLAQAKTETSRAHYYQILGSLSWWQGDFDKARTAFEKVPTPLNKAMLALALTGPGEKIEVEVSKKTAAGMAIAAWQNPQESDRYLTKALTQPTEAGEFPPANYISSLTNNLNDSLAASSTFYEWVTEATVLSNKNQRLGFGTISRHIDGPQPYDFSPRIESLIKILFLESLFPEA
ncbi:MAG: Lipid A core - O-antigen ligase-like protein [Phormidesmis priestleyi Ana]|uniref:Lipid A core-O-antigen ligase-like protein n=1 Tax=Phormidesmis priestleyi Ana TaxID=1666911 RepID=A0A0P7ZLU6_9CYAN|nr:MAG: Lipid A core - O-antigen ligase-like protein [Phormidesmis priestleyi Ana]